MRLCALARGWGVVRLAIVAAAFVSFWLSLGSVDLASAQLYDPDLVVESISDNQQPGGCAAAAGVKVVVRNTGLSAAGPSTTRVSASGGIPEDVATPSLAVGEAVTLVSTVQGNPSGATYTAVADFGGVVAEGNENNNSRSEFLALATLPTCTPTATPTPITFNGTPVVVGGIVVDLAAEGLPLETIEPPAGSAGLLSGVVAATVAVAMVGAAWHVRRRRVQ